MAVSSELLDKLRDYLLGLTEEARQLLVKSIEKSRAKGEMSPVHEIIMDAMRDVMRGEAASVKRNLSVERSFFDPVEMYVIDERLPDKERGRLSRLSMRPIWTWITRDLGPTNLDDELAECHKAEEAGDEKRMAVASKTLRKKVVPLAYEYITMVEERYGGLQRLSMQLGSQRTLEDLHDVLDIMSIEDELAEFHKRLPHKVTPGKGGFAAVDLALKALTDVPDNKMVFAFAALIPHLGAPGDLVRYAVHATRTDMPASIRRTRFAPCISLVLGEIAREIEAVTYNLERDRGSHSSINALLRYHELVRSFTAALDVEGQDPWVKRLSNLRTRLSDRIQPEIEPAPLMVRRVLRGPDAKKKDKEVAPDRHAINDAVFAARFLMASRQASASLALNSLIADNIRVVEQAIETLGERALKDLEQADSANRDARTARVDAAIEMSSIIFGGDVTRLMVRKRNAALGVASPAESSSAA